MGEVPYVGIQLCSRKRVCRARPRGGYLLTKTDFSRRHCGMQWGYGVGPRCPWAAPWWWWWGYSSRRSPMWVRLCGPALDYRIVYRGLLFVATETTHAPSLPISRDYGPSHTYALMSSYLTLQVQLTLYTNFGWRLKLHLCFISSCELLIVLKKYYFHDIVFDYIDNKGIDRAIAVVRSIKFWESHN